MCVRWGGRCSLRCRCGRPLMQLSKEALWCQMWMSEVKALISLFFCRLISAITRLMSPQPSCVSQCRCRWFAAVHVITDAQTQHDSQSHRCSRLCCKVIRIIYYWRRVDAQAAAAWRKTPTGRDSESSRRSQESEELTPELLIVRPQPWIKRQPDDKTASSRSRLLASALVHVALPLITFDLWNLLSATLIDSTCSFTVLRDRSVIRCWWSLFKLRLSKNFAIANKNNILFCDYLHLKSVRDQFPGVTTVLDKWW